MCKLFQLREYILGPGQPLEVLQRFVVLGIEALLDGLVHGGDLLLIVFQKLVLEGFYMMGENTQKFLVVFVEAVNSEDLLEEGGVHGFF